MAWSRKGITLIELLVVMAIIGILAALVGNLLGDRSRFQVREAQTKFASDLERVRNYVRRFNYGYDVAITTSGGVMSYRFFSVQRDGTAVTGTNVPPEINVSMLQGIKLAQKKPSTFNGNVYLAPYGRIGSGGAPICFEITKADSKYETAVDLVGVTGKVISREIVEDKAGDYNACS
jgi:prepilin-type N-terminal cleavage/methylation domain-containing protein